MGEAGCLRDAHFNNLEISGNSIFYGTVTNSSVGLNVLSKNVTYSSGDDIRSGAMSIPANSLIKNIAVIATTALTNGASGATTVKVGISANTDLISSAVNIQASGTSTKVGKGTAVNTIMATSLEGAAPLVIIAGEAHRSAATDLHITVDGNGNISAGAIQFIVEYIKF